MPVGTQDFYFDVAERLARLDVEFLILVRDSNKKAVSIMCNTANQETLRMFTRTAGSMTPPDDTDGDQEA
jgi:hypothetical protein